MGPYGVSMGSLCGRYGSLWGLYGVSACLYGSLWGLCGSLWVPMGRGFVRSAAIGLGASQEGGAIGEVHCYWSRGGAIVEGGGALTMGAGL